MWRNFNFTLEVNFGYLKREECFYQNIIIFIKQMIFIKSELEWFKICLMQKIDCRETCETWYIRKLKQMEEDKAVERDLHKETWRKEKSRKKSQVWSEQLKGQECCLRNWGDWRWSRLCWIGISESKMNEELRAKDGVYWLRYGKYFSPWGYMRSIVRECN